MGGRAQEPVSRGGVSPGRESADGLSGGMIASQDPALSQMKARDLSLRERSELSLPSVPFQVMSFSSWGLGNELLLLPSFLSKANEY